MSGKKLNLKNRQGNVTVVPDNDAAQASRRGAGFFVRRRQLIIAFIVFNIVAWTLLIVITFR